MVHVSSSKISMLHMLPLWTPSTAQSQPRQSSPRATSSQTQSRPQLALASSHVCIVPSMSTTSVQAAVGACVGRGVVGAGVGSGTGVIVGAGVTVGVGVGRGTGTTVGAGVGRGVGEQTLS